MEDMLVVSGERKKTLPKQGISSIIPILFTHFSFLRERNQMDEGVVSFSDSFV